MNRLSKYQRDQRRSSEASDNRPCQRSLGVGSFADAESQRQQGEDDLYRQDGSLLERRGIFAPGREPVKLSKK
jgi:hypothetical protein